MRPQVGILIPPEMLLYGPDGDDPRTRMRVPFGDETKPPGAWVEWHNGREGATRLLNGRSEPELTISGGQVERCSAPSHPTPDDENVKPFIGGETGEMFLPGPSTGFQPHALRLGPGFIHPRR